ncbi:MAG TPA: FAD-binding protein [Desulfurococcales archaeon]|nr:FAD-binding protein [Desulfurococcales archaeon]
MSLRLELALKSKDIVREREYDVIVVGGGPAGITAAIYLARYLLKTLLITKSIGGKILHTYIVENYPGFKSIESYKLIKYFEEHIRSYNVPILIDEVTDIVKHNQLFKVSTRNNGEFVSKAVILAIGVEKRRLNVPGEKEFIGKGVSYCAVCDAPLFKGKEVAVIGGGDSAVTSALLLSRYATKVYLICKESKLIAQPILIERLKKTKNIYIILNDEVIEINGRDRVECIKLKSGRALGVSGVFIEVGLEPPIEFLRKLGLKLTSEGYVEVKPDQSTNIAGLFAAGDITNACNNFKQIITAAAQGAIAAKSAYEYLQQILSQQ